MHIKTAFKQVVACVFISLLIGIACIACDHPALQPDGVDYDLDRFKDQIAAFTKLDSVAPPPAGEILFIGSSTFTNWKSMTADLAPLPILNRGFGGSTIPELSYYASRIVFPYKPKAIVVYGGENDIWSSKTIKPQQVAGNYEKLIVLIRSELPDVSVYFISLKPSPARWSKWPQMQQVNRLVQQYSATNNHLFYLDISQAMLNPIGRPRSELYIADSLHLSTKGYQILINMIKPELTKISQ